METAILSGIDQLFEYINSETSYRGLSFKPLKQSIIAGSEQSLEGYFKSLPVCTPAQLLIIGANALMELGNEGEPMLCNPPDALKELAAIPIRYFMEALLQEIPEQGLLSSSIENLIKSIRIMRVLMVWSPAIPIIFLLLTTLFEVRTWRSLLQWWGYPILGAGAATLVVSLLVSPAIYYAFSSLFLPNLPFYIVPEAVDLVASAFESATLGLAQPIQVQSAFLGFVGLGMVLGERFSRPK
jgi:hypothetical protein